MHERSSAVLEQLDAPWGDVMDAVPIRTLLVDDEPMARLRLRNLLNELPDLEVVGECADGNTAVASILRLVPDLVFLDIEMPGTDGFGVLEALSGRHQPAVVFVTAHDVHAARAFEVHAVDYILKPLDRVRLLHAVHRARAHLLQQRLTRDIAARAARPARPAAGPGRPARFAVRQGTRVSLVAVNDVEWIEAADNYVKLHTPAGMLLMRETMARVEEQLDPAHFIRLHRSFIARVDAIREVQPWFNGEYVVILASGAKLTTGRTYRHRLQALVGR